MGCFARRLLAGLLVLVAAAGPGHAVAATAEVSAQAPAQSCPPVAQLTPEVFQAAAAQAHDRGPLWRITRDGRSSYLYGTLHVGKAQWLAPGPQMQQALRETDALALELDPLDPALQADMAAAFARRAPVPLAPELLARLNKLWAAECLPPEAMAGMPVEMQLATLSVMSGRRDGFDVAYGSEIVLAMFARSAGRPVVSLENAALQIKTLLAQDDAEAQAMVREGLDELEDAGMLAVLRKTARVWETADLDELERYAQWCACFRTELEKKMMKRLLDDRNPGLAGRIDELHAAGGKVFAAVGALHMIGPLGLPRLLAARGYAVQRLR